jgi:adenylate kinase
MKLSIIGPPGSGKGTYAQLLEKKYKLKRITMGNILRKVAKKDKKLKKILDAGNIAPSDAVIKLLHKNLPKNNFILDGYPRTLVESEELIKTKNIDKVFSIKVLDKVIIKRLLGRLQCPKCGRVYHIKNNPPKKDRICDYDKTKLEIRSDEPVIRTRLKIYRRHKNAVLNYFKKYKILCLPDYSFIITQEYWKIL